MRLRALVAVGLLALGCSPPSAPPVAPDGAGAAGEVVARVAGVEVTRADLDGLMDLQRARKRRGDSAPSPSQALDTWIEAYVLKGELEARGLQEGGEYQERLAAIRARTFFAERELARNALIRVLEEEVALSEPDLRQRYEDQAQRFMTTRLRLRQITVPDRATIHGIRKQLADGASFETLAAHANLDPALRQKGGDLGWLEQRRMPTALIGPAHQLMEPGAVSEPFQDREGRWSLVQLVAREKTARRSFEDVRDVLEREVRVVESRTLLEEALERRREALEIERSEGL